MKNIKRKNQKNMPEKGENHPCFWYSSGGDRGFGCVYAKNNSTQPIQARQISAQSSQFKRNSTQLNSTQLNSAKQVSTQFRLPVGPQLNRIADGVIRVGIETELAAGERDVVDLA